MFQTAIGRVRLVGYAEGASFLLLMGIAMPLKYLANIPEAVLAVGWAHGLLFIAYLAVIAWAFVTKQLSFMLAFFGVIAAFLPAGPFVYDRWLPKPSPTS